MTGALLFVGGFAVVFASYGALFGAFGSQLVEHQSTVIRVSGVFTILLGLVFAGVTDRLPLLHRTVRPSFRPRVGLAGAPVLGVIFGVGWTPCIGPALAAVLALATNSSTAGRGVILSLAYSIGLGVPFVLAALSLSRAMRVFTWVRRHSQWVTRGGGALLIFIGLLQVSGVWSALLSWMQVWVGAWQAPL